jgi:hypothetical protein
MYYHEWDLFEEGGDLFLLRSAAPFVFEIDVRACERWTWTELRDVLDQCFDGQELPREKPLPFKELFAREELSKRLFTNHTLVTWSFGEVGLVHTDDLPDPVREFLRLVNAPTFRWLERRSQLKKEEGLHIDGFWLPGFIDQAVSLLRRVGAYPVQKEEGAWIFEKRCTASNGALIDLYEISRPAWGFALRGLEQQEVLRELGAFLRVLASLGAFKKRQPETRDASSGS